MLICKMLLPLLINIIKFQIRKSGGRPTSFCYLDEDGMDQKLHYKEIYQLAKKRIESFAEIHGKTLIPAFEQKQISEDKIVD